MKRFRLIWCNDAEGGAGGGGGGGAGDGAGAGAAGGEGAGAGGEGAGGAGDGAGAGAGGEGAGAGAGAADDSPEGLQRAAGREPEVKPYDLEADPAGLQKIALGEGVKILGKYATVGEVVKALSDTEARFAPPEKYEIAGPEWDTLAEPEREAVHKWMKETGLPAEIGPKVWSGMVELAKVGQEAVGLVSLSEEWKLPVEQTRARMKETLEWAAQVMPESEINHLVKMGAAGIGYLYTKRTSNWEKPAFRGDQTPVGDESAALKKRYPTMFGGKPTGTPLSPAEQKAAGVAATR